jgi:hypothetical protein
MAAPKGNKNAVGNKGGGRRSQYKPEYAGWAEKLAKLGATDADLAEAFDVTEATINAWKKAHVEFALSLKSGKLVADAEVAEALYRRAVGYSHPDVHISNYQGEITVTPIEKHYPPDPTSMIFWLKNRQPAKWRDKPAADDDDQPPAPVKIEISVKDARIRDDDQPDAE